MRNLATPEGRRPDSGRAQPVPEGVPAIEAVGLTKRYQNPWTLKVTRGLEALDLTVRSGEVLGLLGPNGAGKTTTLKLLTGLHKPTSGSARIFGVPVTQVESRRRVGFLPEQPYFYDYLTGLEYLELACRLSGFGGAEASRRAKEWMVRVGLAGAETRVMRKYSKGMLQRTGLAAALLHDPDLLILDEPFSGLDPLGRRHVRDLILEQRARGTTVLFSSHIIPDVEALSDRVAILTQGRLARIATVGELIRDGRVVVEITCEGHPLLEIPSEWSSLVARTDRTNDTVLRVADDRRLGEVLQWLIRCEVRLDTVLPQRVNLEDLYVEATTAAPAASPAERRSA